MKDALANKGVNSSALSEWTRQADVRSFHQGRLARFVERQQPPHLRVEPLISERIRRQLVAQEAADDLLGENDRVQRHELMRRSKSANEWRISSNGVGSVRYMSRISA